MKNQFTLAILLAVMFSLVSCQQNTEKTTSAEPEVPAAPPTQVTTGQVMESLPISQLEAIYTTCDFADFIFYEPSFSMSQDEPASIQQVLGLIAAQPATLDPACKPRGRVFFQVKGEDKLVADIYLGDQCNYFVFIENDKPAFANLMIPQGVQYFNNSIQQVLQMQQEAQQGH
ncbi:MAG: hypothetical protein KDC34_03075 [Saprospiraceae bacterium]|nr:hypothetical protein [Saprospiraceae bacterium]